MDERRELGGAYSQSPGVGLGTGHVRRVGLGAGARGRALPNPCSQAAKHVSAPTGEFTGVEVAENESLDD